MWSVFIAPPSSPSSSITTTGTSGCGVAKYGDTFVFLVFFGFFSFVGRSISFVFSTVRFLPVSFLFLIHHPPWRNEFNGWSWTVFHEAHDDEESLNNMR